MNARGTLGGGSLRSGNHGYLSFKAPKMFRERDTGSISWNQTIARDYPFNSFNRFWSVYRPGRLTPDLSDWWARMVVSRSRFLLEWSVPSSEREGKHRCIIPPSPLNGRNLIRIEWINLGSTYHPSNDVDLLFGRLQRIDSSDFNWV